MSTTTLQELDVVFCSINKYKEFKRLEDGTDDERETVEQYVKLNVAGYKETLENTKLYTIPDAFRQELEGYYKRNKTILDSDFKDAYFFIQKDRKFIDSNKKEKVSDVVYIMTLDEM